MSQIKLLFDGVLIGRLEVEYLENRDISLIFIPSFRYHDEQLVVLYRAGDDRVIDLAHPSSVHYSNPNFTNSIRFIESKIIYEGRLFKTRAYQLQLQGRLLGEKFHRSRVVLEEQHQADTFPLRIAVSGHIEGVSGDIELGLVLDFGRRLDAIFFSLGIDWRTQSNTINETLRNGDSFTIRMAIIDAKEPTDFTYSSRQYSAIFRLSTHYKSALRESPSTIDSPTAIVSHSHRYLLKWRSQISIDRESLESTPSERSPPLGGTFAASPRTMRARNLALSVLTAPVRVLAVVAGITAIGAARVAKSATTRIQKVYQLPAEPRFETQPAASPSGLEGLPPPPPRVTAYRPAWIIPKRQTSIYVYVALPAAQETVRAEAHRALGQPGNRAREAPPIPLRRALNHGERISIRMSLDGFQITQPEPQAWEAPSIRFLIPILAPAGVAIGIHRPILSVYRLLQHGEEALASLDFDLTVRTSSPRRDMLRAGLFASGFSSAIAIVAATHQHMMPPELGWPTSAVCAVGGIGAGIALKPVLLATEVRDQTRIFISYAREDLDRVRSYVAVLNLAGVYPWIDVDQLVGGDRWEQNLDEAMNRADLFFVFWSKHAGESQWVEKELQQAMRRQSRIDHRRFIVPIMLGEDRPEDNHPLWQFQFIFSRDSSPSSRNEAT